MSNLTDEANKKPTANAPAGEPATAGGNPARWCANCEADVDAKGKGHCPICGRFLPENEVGVTHGLRRRVGALEKQHETRRAQLREDVLKELGGTVTTIEAELVDDFVSACVQRDALDKYLDDVGPLTQRGARRAAMDLYLATSARIERLSVQLMAFKENKPERTPTPLPGVCDMPVSALEYAKELLLRVTGGEVLTEREEGALDVLRTAMRGSMTLSLDDAPVARTNANREDSASSSRSGTPPGGESPRIADDAIRRPGSRAENQTFCSYCNRASCVNNADIRRLLHWNDPVEVAKRHEQATAEMHVMLQRQRGSD